ncbi:hypothetical protein LINGRAHAP2_LOCUS24454, partial [Linum grandiflorum]
MICDAPIAPPIPDLHVLNLSDQKHPRIEDDENTLLIWSFCLKTSWMVLKSRSTLLILLHL